MINMHVLTTPAVSRSQAYVTLCVRVCMRCYDICNMCTYNSLHIQVQLSAGPWFDSGRNPVNSNQYGFEQIDPQARVLK